MSPQSLHIGAHRHVPGFQPQTCSLNISWPAQPRFQGAAGQHPGFLPTPAGSAS